jgi:hypothetical protein
MLDSFIYIYIYIYIYTHTHTYTYTYITYALQEHGSWVMGHGKLSCVTRKFVNLFQVCICTFLSPMHDDCMGLICCGYCGHYHLPKNFFGCWTPNLKFRMLLLWTRKNVGKKFVITPHMFLGALVKVYVPWSMNSSHIVRFTCV